MGDGCDEDTGSGPISRSSVTHVAYIVGKFDEEKRGLVREIGFGGILELPHITKVDRKFTHWLLSKVDPVKKSIVVKGEAVADLIDFEVSRIMGIPCGRKKVCPLECDDRKIKLEFIQNFIGSSENENNSLTAAEANVAAQRDSSMAMTLKEKDNFKVSFVVWVMGHLLAPTKKHNVGSDRFWGALLDPDQIKEFNWSAYVVEELISAARDVLDAMKHNRTVNTITGCSILLQVLYFESINMGSLNRPRDILPRVKAYDGKSLSLMIAADKACSSSGSANPTWGSNVYHVPDQEDEAFDTDPQKEDDVDKSNSALENTTINDLGKYVRDKFGDKLTTSQSIAINWFNARCMKHYKDLRLQIQQDTILLVDKLFVPAEPLRTAARPAQSEPSKTILKNKRPYETYSTPWTRRYRKKHHVTFRKHELPETLLSGVSRFTEQEVGDQHSDSGHQSRTASQNSEGFSIDAPSFDLGIDFGPETTEEPHASDATIKIGTKEVASQCSNDSGGVNPLSDMPESSLGVKIAIGSLLALAETSGNSISMANANCIEPLTPSAFSTLPGTPLSAKSMNQPEFTTPEQKSNRSQTSPASLTKILAEADLVVRMTQAEESPNMNIKPWDEGYSDGPITKRLIGTPSYPESPWMYNLCHRTPPRDVVDRFFDEVSVCNYCLLNRPWVAHFSPWNIEIDGIWLRKCLIPESSLSYDVCDLAIRRLKQLDDIMYSDPSTPRWRHLLESEIAMLALADEIAHNREAIVEQFIGSSIQYRLEDCRMIVVPAYILRNWCCYFFDFKENCVHVIDPLYNEDQSPAFKQVHLPNVSKVAASMMMCFDRFFLNWQTNLQSWDVKFVQPPIHDATSDETGLLTLMYMRQFDGSKLHLANRDYFCYFKKLILYEIMSLHDNPVKAPVKLTITIDD